MVCLVCRTPLMLARRHGVEVECCPRCRGVWLDGGELADIVQRVSARAAAAGALAATSAAAAAAHAHDPLSAIPMASVSAAPEDDGYVPRMTNKIS
jgi:Zn-finger nucleic acid-binding protein